LSYFVRDRPLQTVLITTLLVSLTVVGVWLIRTSSDAYGAGGIRHRRLAGIALLVVAIGTPMATALVYWAFFTGGDF